MRGHRGALYPCCTLYVAAVVFVFPAQNPPQLWETSPTLRVVTALRSKRPMGSTPSKWWKLPHSLFVFKWNIMETPWNTSMFVGCWIILDETSNIKIRGWKNTRMGCMISIFAKRMQLCKAAARFFHCYSSVLALFPPKDRRCSASWVSRVCSCMSMSIEILVAEFHAIKIWRWKIQGVPTHSTSLWATIFETINQGAIRVSVRKFTL